MQQKKIVSEIKTELDNFGRKKFTIQEHSEEQEEQKEFIETGRHRSTLQPREEKFNIEKYVGKIQQNRKKANTQVFYCDVCKEGFKCDLAFITHCNSSQHNRKLGMNMKVKAVSASAVAEKLQSLKQKKLKSNYIQVKQVMKKQPEHEQLQSNIESQSQTEKMLKQLGLPTSFGNKKIKR